MRFAFYLLAIDLVPAPEGYGLFKKLESKPLVVESAKS